jgi:hypothetical protein
MSQVRVCVEFTGVDFCGCVCLCISLIAQLRFFLGSRRNWLDERRVEGRGMSWEMRWLERGGSMVRI